MLGLGAWSFSVRSHDVVAFDDDIGVFGSAFDAENGASDIFGADLIIGAEAGIRAAHDDGAIGGFESLAPGIDDVAGRGLDFEQAEDLLRNALADFVIDTVLNLVPITTCVKKWRSHREFG